MVEENNLTVGLWVHETLRVFYDRLINDEDRTWLTGLLSSETLPHLLHLPLHSCTADAQALCLLHSAWAKVSTEAAACQAQHGALLWCQVLC